ncbi:uncharacterized protein LOC128296910 [Anopheles moucheti]|uniref:uncharacterized protein LOC128296910 n=1 Tax=Anopheles moucheti TaxID=186751 RepID=UPI0022F07631|nr:uncharacterized protein LOC128296910 [Anopheles moucheti]
MHIENVCRLCLTDASEAGDMFPIFPVRGGNPHSPTSVVNRILQCTSLRLEHTEGVPATICELCSVRLEDWHAFREQCLGSDEYLRVTLRHAFYPDEGQTSHSASSNSALPILPPNGNQLTKSMSIHTDSMSTKSSPIGRNVSMTPPPPVSSRLSLAKRRQSTFEMPVSDGKGNTTDQKILVEVLGVCNDTGKRPSVPTFDGTTNGQQEKPNGFSTLDNTMLEQASWSREYCARINNLMVKVNGPRPFKCKVCRRMFNNRTNMRRHIKVLHSDEVFEGESPPPECYGYTDQAEQSHQDTSRPPVKKKRKSTDPPIVGPYKCEVCPRSFKMPAHLAVHRKTHRQIEFDHSELSRVIEQQKRQMQQQQRERSSSAVSSEVDRTRKTTTIEPCDVIQLSDDDEEEDPMGKALQRTTFGAGDDLDDGFDEEEGSLKEASSLDVDLRPDPSSLAIVQIGAEDNDGPEQQVTSRRHDEEEDEDVMVVVQDVESKALASKPKPGPSSSSRAPPGPLSSKLKYGNQTASNSGTGGAKQQQKPLKIAAKPIEDLQRRQSSLHSTAAGPAGKQKPATVGTPPTTEQQQSSSSTTTTVHRCHLCRHTFPREDMLRDHQKSHQHDSPCAYRCGWCKKGFRYRQNYTLHLEKQTCRLINADPVRALQQQQQQQAGKCT